MQPSLGIRPIAFVKPVDGSLMDVDGDSIVSPIDALWLVNHLNQSASEPIQATNSPDEEERLRAAGAELKDSAPRQLINRFTIAYQRGMLALATGDCGEALFQFQKCEKIGHLDLDINFFVQRND